MKSPKIKILAIFMSIILLSDSMVLVGEQCFGKCDESSEITDNFGSNDPSPGFSLDSEDHEQHASHCCHIQSHFQCITQKIVLVTPIYRSSDVILVDEYLHSLTLSPLFRPPIV